MSFSINNFLTRRRLIYSAMAAAVENSSVILSFLTDRYQQSVNCNLELKYAVSRNKPIVFIRAQQNLQLKDWIQEIVSKSVVFEMTSISDAGKMDSGIPRINRVSEAIRKLAQWQAKRVQTRDDVSEEVYNLQDQLEDALYWIHKNEGTKRFETCSRCGAKYDEDSKAGCKKHGAYYMGGTIMVGRWVCCQQREKEGMGCQDTFHISSPRKFQQMSGYGGCFKWNPE